VYVLHLCSIYHHRFLFAVYKRESFQKQFILKRGVFLRYTISTPSTMTHLINRIPTVKSFNIKVWTIKHRKIPKQILIVVIQWGYFSIVSMRPNVIVEWLAHLFRILEVLDSNIGSDSGYPDWGFCGFPQFLYENARLAHWIRPWQLPSISFRIYCSPIILHDAILFQLLTASLNKSQTNKISVRNNTWDNTNCDSDKELVWSP
jgi:hypothetical protein